MYTAVVPGPGSLRMYYLLINMSFKILVWIMPMVLNLAN
eukprot:SAG31_NODE_25790_length_454_cov_0.718310_1_plen_38_part_01